MIKSCREVLKGLRKLSNNSDETLSYLGSTTCICLGYDLEATYDYAKYSNEIDSIIKELISTGYLEYSIDEYHFSLTHKGLHPYRYRWEDIKTFLFTSVLIPAIVSFLTALITLLVESW